MKTMKLILFCLAMFVGGLAQAQASDDGGPLCMRGYMQYSTQLLEAAVQKAVVQFAKVKGIAISDQLAKSLTVQACQGPTEDEVCFNFANGKLSLADGAVLDFVFRDWYLAVPSSKGTRPDGEPIGPVHCRMNLDTNGDGVIYVQNLRWDKNIGEIRLPRSIQIY